ncbi:MAG: pirin family protein [Nitrososphaeraceae archaeon]
MARNDNMVLGKDTNNDKEKQQQESQTISDSERSSSRSVSRVIDSVQTLEGEGFLVHRAFPSKFIEDFDPFLLLDEFGPINLAPGEAKGAPDHPHRGFETVTYMLDGQFEHKDSQGNKGKLNPGDVQWMTAGAGVIHSEMPSEELTNNGGNFHGLQLWVNLPKKDKMIKPRYQDISSSRIPMAKNENQNVQVKVIAGEALGADAVIDTRTPIMYLHYTLKPGSEIAQPVPKEYNVFAYVINGRGTFGKDNKVSAGRGQMVIFKNDADQVFIGRGVNEDSNRSSSSAEEPEYLDVLLVGGLPLDESVARYGPFVMNTKAEVYQAVSDFQNGRMGRIK